MTQQENDIRVCILNSFMTCPHRDTEELSKIHKEMRQKDPVFYSHLAAWYFKNGDLRDHNEIFTAMLLTDSFLENRNVGLALFQKHLPFMKTKILGFIKGKNVTLRQKTGAKKKIGKKIVEEVKNIKKKVGLEKNVPSSLKTEITSYLRWLESDNERFDSVALKNFKDLKTMYAAKGLQIKPSIRAQKILFKEDFPKDSKLSVFKKIINSKSPEETATLIVENKIPFTIAIGLIEKITPTILIALINNMSPQEVINNYASLEEKGAMENDDLKQLILKKMEAAKSAKKVTALKPKTAIKTGRVKNEEAIKQLNEIADKQIKKSGTIDIPTALLIDRSGSMDRAIEIGKQVASTISGVSTSSLHVVAFDTSAQLIKSQGKTLTDWEKAFAPIRAGGGTSIGCGLDFLIRYKLYAEQIIIITDECENNSPKFVDVFPKYIKAMNVTPSVVIIRLTTILGTMEIFSNDLKKHSIAFDVYTPKNNDYYGLPGLVSLLSRKSKLDLVYEIMDYPLPIRKVYA